MPADTHTLFSAYRAKMFRRRTLAKHTDVSAIKPASSSPPHLFCRRRRIAVLYRQSHTAVHRRRMPTEFISGQRIKTPEFAFQSPSPARRKAYMFRRRSSSPFCRRRKSRIFTPLVLIKPRHIADIEDIQANVDAKRMREYMTFD